MSLRLRGDSRAGFTNGDGDRRSARVLDMAFGIVKPFHQREYDNTLEEVLQAGVDILSEPGRHTFAIQVKSWINDNSGLSRTIRYNVSMGKAEFNNSITYDRDEGPLPSDGQLQEEVYSHVAEAFEGRKMRIDKYFTGTKPIQFHAHIKKGPGKSVSYVAPGR